MLSIMEILILIFLFVAVFLLGSGKRSNSRPSFGVLKNQSYAVNRRNVSNNMSLTQNILSHLRARLTS